MVNSLVILLNHHIQVNHVASLLIVILSQVQLKKHKKLVLLKKYFIPPHFLLVLSVAMFATFNVVGWTNTGA